MVHPTHMTVCCPIVQAGVAKLDTSLTIVGDKLELRVYGFNDKLSTLLLKILTLSKSFSPREDRFLVQTASLWTIYLFSYLLNI